MSLQLTPGVEPVPGYRLTRRLGSGNAGEVWEAEAPGGVRVALKIIALDGPLAGPELRALEVIRNIRHPNLLDVQFAIQQDDDLVIAMPLCDLSLMDRLRECLASNLAGIPRDELLIYMEEAAKAIDFLNAPRHLTPDGEKIGVQHRDVKPHNIFLVGGSVRLADFGLAKALGGTSGDHTGAMTPMYAAPEVLDGIVATQTDQYALAITYVQLRTGRAPFSGEVSQILQGHLAGRPNLDALPEDERPILARALAKRPEDRWRSCREMVTQLQACGGDRTNPDVPGSRTVGYGGVTRTSSDPAGARADPTRTDPTLTPPRHRFGPVLMALLATAAVAAIFFFAWRDGGGGPALPARPNIPIQAATAKPSTPSPVAVAPAATGSRVDVEPPKVSERPRPIVVRFDPPSAEVTIDGKPRDLDPEGRAELPGDTAAVFEIAARHEGYQPLDRRVTGADLARDGYRLRLAAVEVPEARPFRTEKDILKAIVRDLDAAEKSARKYRRYFTLTNLANADHAVFDRDLKVYEQALIETLNRQGVPARPVAVMPLADQPTVYAVDIRELGWNKGSNWVEILKAYPYGMTHQDEGDPLGDLGREISELSGSEIVHIRADWFVDHSRTTADAAREPSGPVALLSRRYAMPLGLIDVASEVGIEDVEALKVKIAASRLLLRNGLGPLLDGGTISRAAWEQAFDFATSALEIGTFHRTF